MAQEHWVEGETAKRTFTLLEDGSAVNLTGMTLALVLTKPDGTEVTTTGDTAIETAASGIVSYTPDSSDLAAADSPLQARWKVTDGGGLHKYYPSKQADIWIVRKP